MFNEFLSTAEGKEHMQQRMQEAETYRLHRQLGYSDRKIIRWAVLLVILLLAVAIVMY